MRLREGLRLSRGPARIPPVRRRRSPSAIPRRRRCRHRHRCARSHETGAFGHPRDPARTRTVAPQPARAQCREHRRTEDGSGCRDGTPAPRRRGDRRRPALPRSDRRQQLPSQRPALPRSGRRQPRCPPTPNPARATTNGPPVWATRSQINRRRPTLPGPCGPSTIGAEGLNCSVRKGKRCFPLAITTGNRREPWALQNCTVALRCCDEYQKVIRQALDPLVPVSFAHYCASRSGLSTWWSTRGLTPSWGWESSSRGRLPA